MITRSSKKRKLLGWTHFGKSRVESHQHHYQQHETFSYKVTSSTLLNIIKPFVNSYSLYLTLTLILWCIQYASGDSRSYSSTHQYLHYNSQSDFVPCKDVFGARVKNLPCLCSRNLENSSTVNCDHIAFFGQFPLLPYRSSITTFTQRYSGVQNLEPQLFTASDVRLRKVDFSHNLLRRLMERIFDGIENSLLELNLSYNLLGDQLNPIFSSNEFLSLRNLRVLDLSYNQFRALDSNLFKGTKNLTHLNLEGNELREVPLSSLAPVKSLRLLNLGSNYLSEITTRFPSGLSGLRTLNFSNNRIRQIEDTPFIYLAQLESLYLAHNKLRSLNPSAAEGLRNLETLDLTENFLEHVPIEFITHLKSLKKLLLGSNSIQTLEENTFSSSNLPHLEHLDLSRNLLSLLPGSYLFNGLSHLKILNLAYNTIRKLEESEETQFSSLIKLEVLDLTDNHLTSFPSNIFYVLPNLRKLFLDYNMLKTITEEMMNSVIQIEELSLAYNLIHEIPDNVFNAMANLKLLNLHGNKIFYVHQDTFTGIWANLLGLDIGFNDLTELPKLVLPRLLILNLARNQILRLEPKEMFEGMPGLRHLNLSFNLITHLSPGILGNNKMLEVIDLKGNQIEKIDRGVFLNASHRSIDLSRNKIKELSQGAFEYLKVLHTLDLSGNEISSIKNNAFDRLPSLKRLHLSGNKLTSFKGDFFSAKTKLEEIDLSGNHISYLYPNSFIIHRKLRFVNLGNNKLSYFPSEILNAIRSLESINLSHNKLQSLESTDFANMPRLRQLNLSGNEISFVSADVFLNSTLLQWLDLSKNHLSGLAETTFKGIARLNLDLSQNSLKTLHDEIFNRQLVFVLESLNLANNNFTEFPSTSLKKQYSSLEKVDISNNQIQKLPANSDVLVNIKDLDLSNNPLTSEAHQVLFGEPKSVRRLNVALTKIEHLPPSLETPFLRLLNLSGNNISHLDQAAFERANLLETLDLSHNKLPNINENVKSLWKRLESLRELYLSHNPIQYIMKTDLINLKNMEILDLSFLPALTHLECDTFSSLKNLRVLRLYSYKSLNYLEVQGCLSHINSELEELGIEVKERFLQGHLQRAFSNRLRKVLITGNKLNSLSPGCLLGLRNPDLKLTLMKTGVNTIPPAIFSSLPMSSKIEFELLGNEIPNVNYPLLNMLDTKQMHVKVMGLESNPINCDCNIEPLWKWAQEKIRLPANEEDINTIQNISNLTCFLPKRLRGQRLVDIEPEELNCPDVIPKITSSATPPTVTVTTRKASTYNYHLKPDIIFEIPSTKAPHNRGLNRNNERRSSLTKIDTMIIGIVSGVIAFVCILVLIICVIRFKTTTGGSSGLAASFAMRHHGGGCTCLKPMQSSCNSCYSNVPPAPATVYSHAGTIRSIRAPPPLQYYGNTLRPVPIKMVPSVIGRSREQ